MSDGISKPAGTPAEIFARVLENSATWLAPEYASVLSVPDDELHREILLPLLPAMLADKAIRQGWRDGLAGFFSRVRAHVEAGAPAPRWVANDFEIPVASSYLAGPDAKALADTLLSEPSLRDLTAELMNRVLDTVWPRLPVAAPVVPEPVVVKVPVPVAVEPSPTAKVPEPEIVEAEPAEPEVAEPAPQEIAEPAVTEIEPAAAVAQIVVSSSPEIRVTGQRRNPIRGTRHTFGGLAKQGPLSRNPLRHVWPFRLP